MSQQTVGLVIIALAIVLPLVLAVTFVWTDHKRKMQLMEHKHRERIAAIEKGLLPLDEPPPDERPSAYLFRGLVALAMGVVFIAGPFEQLGIGFQFAGWVMVAIACPMLSYFGYLMWSARQAPRKDESRPLRGP